VRTGGTPKAGEVAKAGARPRTAVPRERSGPIGISKGDFSTPIVRRRTTTQPRGLPIAAAMAASAAASEAPAEDAGATDAAATEGAANSAASARAGATGTAATDAGATGTAATDAGATGAAATDAGATGAAATDAGATGAAAADAGAAGARAPGAGAVGAVPEVEQARPAPSGDDGPFAAPGAARADLVSEAAALAAEAAAVRALDSGPLTPPPELLTKETLAASPHVADAGKADPADPMVDPASAPTPPPVVEVVPPSAVATPAPTPPVGGAAPGDDDAMAEAVTPPPEPDAPASRPVVAAAASESPAAIDAPIRVDAPVRSPTAAEAVEVTGALPTSPLGGGGSGASPEPSLVASETELEPTNPRAAIPVAEPEPEPEPEVDEDDPLEVVEAGSEGAADGASPSASPSDGAAKGKRTRTPPPIPGTYLKTPGPELVATATLPGEDGVSPLLPGLSILPEALAQRPRRPKRSKPWFEEVFDEDYLRTLPFMRADQTLREVEFISDTLRLGAGTEVLDVACGYGRHAIELVQRGVNVTGLDLSLPLLIRAADEAQRRGLSVNFVHADMREMAFERQFDGAYSMLTSFGYFDEETNLRVAERVARALKPGARFLLDIVNRDYVVSDLPVRVWWEGTGCVVLEEVDFNFHTSRILTHRSIVFEDGRQLEQEISVRAYSLHEIGRLLRQAGFRVIDVSGALATRGNFFGTSSRSLLIVAEKREEDVT
jgi:SAM-dependent methyltransferase